MQHFDEMADSWWDINGPCKALHSLNPIRLQYIVDHTDLRGKSVLDLGCGGGILSESLAFCGSHVTGVDPADKLIKIASLHAQENNLNIEYINKTAESYFEYNHNQNNPKKFDIIVCMELLEHVEDPVKLIMICKELVTQNGLMFFATINRTLSAYALAIIGAEHLLKLLPVGTHEYSKFIKPSELAKTFRDHKLELINLTGMSYNPLTAQASFTDKVDVNYLACAKKIT